MTDRVTLTIDGAPIEAQRGGLVKIGVPTFRPCRDCGGTGYLSFYTCETCWGHGVEERERIVSLEIPPLVADGTVFEIGLSGLGIRNFFLRVHVRIDPSLDCP